MKTHPPAPARAADSAAFLLAQVGAHAAAQFGEGLHPLGLTRPQSGILRLVAATPGVSQQQLARTLGMAPSRLVVLTDELQARKLLERRPSPRDRRRFALHLTLAGKRRLAQIARIAQQHEQYVCAALSASEHDQLIRLLSKIALQQGLRPGVHPGFARYRPPDKPRS